MSDGPSESSDVMRRLAWVGPFLVIFSGCNPPQTCPSTPVTGAGAVTIPFAIAGQPVTVAVPVPGRVTTCKGPQFATSVSVVVLDPFNQQVVVAIDNPVRGDVEPVRFTFTPSLPGSYHLSASFEPSLGTVQLDIPAAADRRAGPVYSVPVPVECARFDLSAEVAFCIEPSQSKLDSIIDGGVVTQLPAHDFALAPDLGGVWVLAPDDSSDDLLQFYALDGGAMTKLGQVTVSDPDVLCNPSCGNSAAFQLADGRVIAQGDRALVFLPPHLVIATLDGGVHYAEIGETNQLGAIGSPQTGDLSVLQWAGGDAVEFIGSQGTDSFHDFCTAGSDGGCFGFVSPAVGASSDAVWVWDATNQALSGAGVTPPGAQVRAFTLKVPNEPDPTNNGYYDPQAPVAFSLDAGLMLVGSHGGSPSLSLYALPLPRDRYWGADSHRVWQYDAAGQRVFWIVR